jgi:hypothetical protein
MGPTLQSPSRMICRQGATVGFPGLGQTGQRLFGDSGLA